MRGETYSPIKDIEKERERERKREKMCDQARIGTNHHIHTTQLTRRFIIICHVGMKRWTLKTAWIVKEVLVSCTCIP
jgi:hypothetical protein